MLGYDGDKVDPLELFEEEYNKIQKSVGAVTALLLQSKDMYQILDGAYKKLIDLRSDFDADAPSISSQLDILIDSMQVFLSQCKNLTYDLDLAAKSVSSLKDH